MICWDRGRPARKEREGRKLIASYFEAYVCARDARGPSKSLDRHALLRQLASSKIQRNFNSERAAKPNDYNY